MNPYMLYHHDHNTSIFYSTIGAITLFLPILFYASNSYLSLAGSGLLILCYLLAVIDNIKKPILFTLNTHSMLLLSMIVWFTFSWATQITGKGLYNLALALGGLYIFYYFTQQNHNRLSNLRLKKFSLILLLILIPLGLYMGTQGGISEYKGYEPYFNRVFFKLMLPLSFFPALYVKRKYLIWIPMAILYFFMVERTSAIISVVILFTYYGLVYIKGFSRNLNWVFWLVIFLMFVFIVVYVALPSTDFGIELNKKVRELTQKNLFSGRQFIWKAVLDFVAEKPFLGYGFQAGLLESVDISFSTHNAYLYILLHAGIPGLILFIAYLYSFWKVLAIQNNSNAHQALSYYLAFLMFMNFELTLVANTMVLGLYYTLCISTGYVSTLQFDQRLNEKYVPGVKYECSVPK